MLKVTMTDGVITCSGIELETVDAIRLGSSSYLSKDFQTAPANYYKEYHPDQGARIFLRGLQFNTVTQSVTAHCLQLQASRYLVHCLFPHFPFLSQKSFVFQKQILGDCLDISNGAANDIDDFLVSFHCLKF